MTTRTRDIIKTGGAIVVIGGLILATFLYGNKQRHDQQKTNQANQQVKQQQDQQATQSPPPAQQQPTPSPAASVPSQPAATPQTGSGLDGLVALGSSSVLIWLFRAQRRSKRQLRQAALQA